MYGNNQPPKGYSRKRIEQLSTPKQSKQEYSTGFDNWQLRWGDKDSMWHISDAAKKAACSERLQSLSCPKKDFKNHDHEVHLYTYSCGRSSPLNETHNKMPDVVKRVRKIGASQRIKELAQPKTLPTIAGKLWTYSCGRESPIWQTRKPSVKRPSEHDERLALPKLNHRNFVQNRELKADGRLNQSFIKKLQDRGDNVCTDRLASLSEAKANKRNENNFFSENAPEKCIRPVMKATIEATASERVEELAKPNDKRYENYRADQFSWPVKRAALHHKITDRTQTLSKAVVRPSMEHTQYDPTVFFVKKPALTARCSNRLAELANPIKR